MKNFIYIGFSTATSAMRQTFVLHLFTTTNNALCMTFWLGLTCYINSSVHRFTWCSGGKATRMLEEIPLAHVVPARWICGSLCQSGPKNFSLPLNDRWIGRGRPMAWFPRLPYLTPMDSFPWDHTKALILLPVSLRRQQPVIVESHINLCCVVVSCLSRSVAIRLNICSKLVWNTTFLQNTSVVLLYFQP
jgi:hypothetical protein